PSASEGRLRYLLVRVNAGEVVPHQILVTLGNVVAFEGVTCLLLVLAVYLLVGHLGGACIVDVGVCRGAALLAVGVVLAFEGDGRACTIHAAWRGVHWVGVAFAPTGSGVASLRIATRLPLSLPALTLLALALTLCLP